MAQALGYATESFEAARAKGIVATGGEGAIYLGADIDIGSVTVTDIHKDSYKIRFNLQHVDGRVSRYALETTLFDFDYQTCSIREASLSQLDHPLYRVFTDRG